MRRSRQGRWCQVLAAWLCLVLVLGGVPRLPARAQEAGVEAKTAMGVAAEDTTGPADDSEAMAAEPIIVDAPFPEEPGPDESADHLDAPGPDESADHADAPVPSEPAIDELDDDTPATATGEPAPDDLVELSAYSSGSLSQTLKASDGHTYRVTVTYDEAACIPKDAQLRVELVDDVAAGEGLAHRVERALRTGADDRMLAATYLNVSIEARGNMVEPASALDASVTTDAIKPSRSSFVEVVLLGDEADANDAEASVDESVAVKNLTKDEADVRSAKLSFAASRLGTIALASVATRRDAWAGDGLTVSLLVPRQGPEVCVADAQIPDLPDGMDLVACGSVQVDPSPAYGTSVWLEARPTKPAKGPAQGDGLLGELCVYRLGEGMDAPGKPLCGPQGTGEPVELRAGDDRLLLVRDRGRQVTATDAADITVEGLTTQDVSDDPSSLSSSFRIKASAKTYARASTVTYVTTDKSPILGTVTGTLNLAYTGGGAESNETNTVDMYGFIDKLDPSIVDEYDFSRVYVQLTATNEKDFRYIQVGDGTAIAPNGDPGTYRAYFYMDDIAQNAAGQDYYGTWYQLSNGGDMDKVYIEYYHVAPASFHALDTRNDPVEGAEFALYVDPDCYVPLEYKNVEVTATSNRRGEVSFGKIPQGTYYMKETVIPEGFKKTTDIHTVVVDGVTPIDNVIHDDDDGSVIISDVLRMTLVKEWDDGADKHKDDSVEVTVYARGKAICDPITLSAKNDWTHTLDGLDPNEPYMVSETCVTSNGADVTSKWIPTITYEELDPHAEYYRADEFKRDKQYVLVTTTSGGTRALDGGGGLTTTPLAADGIQITGEVTDAVLWNVDSITKDGVIALRNMASDSYLDKAAKWYANPAYPVPLYVHNLNDAGVIKFYHRPNLNAATANYLYVWNSGSREGNVDNYASNASQAANFDLYRKVNVRSVDVTIANRTTRYPIRVQSVTYPNGAPLSGTTFDLYTQEEYDAKTTVPSLGGLVADDDGFLCSEDEAELELGAGTYYLKQTGYAAGYARVSEPVKFTITRGGALKVAQEDHGVEGFAYSGTYGDGASAMPLLRVPNWVPTTFEVTMAVDGAYADTTRAFELAVTVPEGMARLVGTVEGDEVVFAEDRATVSLAHGQTLRFEDVPATVDYVFAQAKADPYEVRAQADTPGAVTLDTNDGESFSITLSGLRGTADDPAHVTIVNVLPDYAPPATGLSDNVAAWSTIALLCVCALAALWLRAKVADRG